MEWREGTYKRLLTATVLDLNERMALLIKNTEGPVLQISLNVDVFKPTTYEALHIEYSVPRVGGEGVLGGIAYSG